MSTLKKLFGQTAVYGLSSIVGRLLNYLLVPIHTAVFTPGQYGVFTELYAEIAFLNIIYTFGLETTFFRFSSREPDKQLQFFSISESIILVLSAVLSGSIIFFSSEIATALNYAEYSNLIRWIGFIMAIDALVAIPFARLRLQGKAFKFASFKLINIGINFSLNAFFLLALPAIGDSRITDLLYDPDLGVGYVFLSNLIANALFILFFARDFLRLRLVFSWKKWRPMLVYAWPLVVLGLAGVTNEMFSRVMLKYLLPVDMYPNLTNQEALGIFGACYKLSIFMTLAIQAFKYAYEPFFFKESVESEARSLYARVMQSFVFFGSLAWIGIVVVLPELAPIFIRKEIYLQGLEIVPILLGGGLLLGIYYNLSLWYKLTDKTMIGALISIIGVVLTVALNFLLIPLLGYTGSAWATFITYLVMVVISFLWGQKVYPVPYQTRQTVFLFAAAAGISYIVFQLEDDMILRYGVGVLVLLAYGTGFWVFINRRRKKDMGNS